MRQNAPRDVSVSENFPRVIPLTEGCDHPQTTSSAADVGTSVHYLLWTGAEYGDLTGTNVQWPYATSVYYSQLNSRYLAVDQTPPMTFSLRYPPPPSAAAAAAGGGRYDDDDDRSFASPHLMTNQHRQRALRNCLNRSVCHTQYIGYSLSSSFVTTIE